MPRQSTRCPAAIYAAGAILSIGGPRSGGRLRRCLILWHGFRGEIVTEVPLFQIRPYAERDRDAVVALWQVCGLLRAWNDPLEDIALCLRSPGARLFVASGADDDGTGGLRATIMCGSDGHRGWLYYLAVDPTRRREGLARRMVRHAEDWLAGCGIRKVELMIRPENDAVRAFYERVGYEVEPRLVMSRWLRDDE